MTSRHELLLIVAAFTTASNCVPCDNDPGELLHGSRIFLQGRRLVQYVCGRGYQALGRPLLSCSNGRWKGKPPVCVGSGCSRPPRPLNAEVEQGLNGGLLRYTCRTGFEMEGEALIYCDGQGWNGTAPTCTRVTPEIPIPEDAKEVEEVPTIQPVYAIRKPLFMDAREGSSAGGNLPKSAVLPLYKTAGSSSGPDRPVESETPKRRKLIVPVKQRVWPGRPLGRDSKQPASNPYQHPTRFSSYANQRQRQNSYFRNHPVFRQQANMFPRVYGQPHGQIPTRQTSMTPHLRPLQPGFTHSPYAYPRAFGTHNRGRNTTGRSLTPEHPTVGGSYPDVRYFRNENHSPLGSRSQGNQLLTPDVPVPETVSSNRRPVACPTPRKPRRGYHTTRPLPKDYAGDEYMYYLEYHCIRGLVLRGGNKTSYCTINGRWTGKLPSCVEPIKSKATPIKEYPSCTTGFARNQNGLCADVDECEKNGTCTQDCRNFDGGYICECFIGYILTDDRKTCVDLNECEADQPCGHSCRNAPGSFSCSCRTGYVLLKHDNRTCLDVNECLENDRNLCEHSCLNTFGSFECACHLGYHLNEDRATCSETCPPGFMLEIDLESGRETCVDINECDDSSNCSLLCVNTPGSFSCFCPGNQIISGDGLSCIGCPRNKYKNQETQQCVECPTNSEAQESANTTGIAECFCQPGFRGSPALFIPCTDIDECEDENYGCSHRCINTVGSVHCHCPAGYELERDGRNCRDIDECAHGQEACGKGGLCSNVEGSYNCSCGHGYEKNADDDRMCVDIDECAFSNGGCGEQCHNQDGGYRCSCRKNSHLDDDGKSCISTRRPCNGLEQRDNGRILPTIQCGQEMVNDGRVCLYTCYRGYKIAGQSRRLCRDGTWTGQAPKCVSESHCPAIVISPSVGMIPRDCSGGNNDPSLVCTFSCKRSTDVMIGSNRTRCQENREWSSEPPRCADKSAPPPGLVKERTCPSLETLENGRILPSTPCVNDDPVRWGRICLYACQSGYRVVGPHRRMCRPGGWSGITPKCVPSGWCPAMPVPNHITVYPSACSEHISRPMLLCIFVCKHSSHIMIGSNSTRCGRNRQWSNSPPKCAGNSPMPDSSIIPRILCPRDLKVDLAPGKAVANVTIGQPITNMNIIEHRSDGSSSRNTFGSGITRVRFTAFTDDRTKQASCEMKVHVRDKEPPVIQKCPGTVSLESQQKYPKVSWEIPLFSDNVRVKDIKKSQDPPGNFTWGAYSISYAASDAVGNMAECAFTVRITHPKNHESHQGSICGSPNGPRNGRAICKKWARGIYCVASCHSGYAFERRPSTYVCDDEGTWTPTNEVPDCISIRGKIRQRKNRLPVPPTSVAPTTVRKISLLQDAEEEQAIESSAQGRGVVPRMAINRINQPMLHATTEAPATDGHGFNTSLLSKNTSVPEVKVLSKPKFFRVPIKRAKNSGERSRNVIQPTPVIKSTIRGQLPPV